MPEEATKPSEKLVDLDTSGEGAEVEIKEEGKNDESVNVSTESVDTSEKSDVSVDVQESKQETKNEEKEETKKETQDEKLEEYSDSVKKRISKLTRKWREAERQKDAAIDYARGVEQKRKTWESRYKHLDSAYLKDSETRVKSQLDAVKAKLAAAIESGDTAKQVEAQTELSTLTTDANRIATEKSRRETYERETPRAPQYREGMAQPTPQSLPQVDEKAETWAEKNTWFGKDKPMTYTAFEHHKDLVESEGMDPTSDEYYAEIDKRMRLDFPHKFGKTNINTTKPAQTVAPVRRGVKPGRKTVNLTSSQVQIAKKLGVPLEEYAKQVLNTEGA
jgi:hypothetical protein